MLQLNKRKSKSWISIRKIGKRKLIKFFVKIVVLRLCVLVVVYVCRRGGWQVEGGDLCLET